MPSVISPVEKYYTKQLCVYVLCGSERTHTGLLTAVTFGAKRKKRGFGVRSVEGGSQHFLVIFQFYFNKENVILPLKCNFKIQKIMESLAYFLALRFFN